MGIHERATSPMAQSGVVSPGRYDGKTYIHSFSYAAVAEGHGRTTRPSRRERPIRGKSNAACAVCHFCTGTFPASTPARGTLRGAIWRQISGAGLFGQCRGVIINHAMGSSPPVEKATFHPI